MSEKWGKGSREEETEREKYLLHWNPGTGWMQVSHLREEDVEHACGSTHVPKGSGEGKSETTYMKNGMGAKNTKGLPASVGGAAAVAKQLIVANGTGKHFPPVARSSPGVHVATISPELVFCQACVMERLGSNELNIMGLANVCQYSQVLTLFLQRNFKSWPFLRFLSTGYNLTIIIISVFVIYCCGTNYPKTLPGNSNNHFLAHLTDVG